MVKSIDKVDLARDDRIREQQKEAARSKPKESDFNEVLQKSRMPLQPGPVRLQSESKVATEYAIREAVKHEERRGDEQKKDRDDKEDKRDSRRNDNKPDAKIAEQKVIAKGTLKQGGGQSGKGKQGGFGMASDRREMVKALKKAGVKTVPVDLKGKFASKLSQAMKSAQGSNQAAMTQQVLGKIIQYVRIGMNRKGEKEIQIDLHEKIFRGLKLRVISREGKVAVMFSTSDRKGREVLEKNKDDITKALKDKGIEVDEIKVT